jgi:hypothetical protein
MICKKLQISLKSEQGESYGIYVEVYAVQAEQLLMQFAKNCKCPQSFA